MVAFVNAPVSFRLRSEARRDVVCATRRQVYACAKKPNGVVPSQPEPRSDDSVQSAIDSGAVIRGKLEQVAQDRKEQAIRVEASIKEMNLALDSILSKLQENTDVSDSNERTVQNDAASALSSTSTVASDGDESGGSSVPSTSYMNSDAEPYMDPSTFGMDSTGGWQVLANSDALPSSNAPVKFRIECDGSGCSIIEMEADAAPGPGVRQRYVHSGRGFRVGYDPEAPDSFCGMVGTDQWLLAMDKQEMRHFKRLVTAVARKMARIDRGDEEPPSVRATPAVRRSGDGMFNERVASMEGAGCSVEMESKLMWVQAVGKPRLGSYAVRVIFMERRQSEGYWSAEVVPSMLVAVTKLAVE